MEGFLGVIAAISNWLWGLPLLGLLVFGGIFFSFRLGFFHIKHVGYIFKQTIGKMFDKSTQGEGTVTQFQALTSALASTVGAGNIVGVPVAIMLGGPGAVFWMWFVALLGMSLKYAEVVLALKYREKNELGEYVGGPMYYMTKGLNMKWLGMIFAVGLMFEVVPSTMVQANSLAGSAAEVFKINPMVTGIATMILVAMVVIGGIKRIGTFTEKFVPGMALLYVGTAIIVTLINITEIPSAIGMIFAYAFQPMSAVGGFTGSAIAASIRWGFARGLYSNEAGLGTAPIAHATATVDHPVRQGLWGIMEVFLDTIIIASATAFAILTSGVWKLEGAAENPSALSAMAFTQSIGSIGGAIVTISLLLFVVSTLIVLIYYGEKQAEFIFGLKFSKIMKYVYVLSIPIGAVGGAKIIWQFLDISLAIILIPNMLALLLLNKEVLELTKEFFTSEKYYLKDINKAKAK